MVCLCLRGLYIYIFVIVESVYWGGMAWGILFVTGGSRWSPPRITWAPRRRFSHPGAAGVCDGFHHLDGSVLMNILIVSSGARACWASSRSAFSSRDKYGEVWLRRRGSGRSPSEASSSSFLLLLYLFIFFGSSASCDSLASCHQS